jgi:hypothetical protein
MIIKEDFEELQSIGERIEIAMNEFDSLLHRLNPVMYEQWKAGGKAATNEYISMYPSVPEILDQLESTIDLEDSEE